MCRRSEAAIIRLPLTLIVLLAKAAIEQRRIVDFKAPFASLIDGRTAFEESVGQMHKQTIKPTRKKSRRLSMALAKRRRTKTSSPVSIDCGIGSTN